MIITEYYYTRDDGVKLYRTYSDAGFTILQNETGMEYDEAVDVEGSNYTYSETENEIAEDISPDEALEILLGGDVNEPT